MSGAPTLSPAEAQALLAQAAQQPYATYGQGNNPDAGSAATPEQQAYFLSHPSDPSQPQGSPANPYGATPSVPGDTGRFAYVDRMGVFHAPASQRQAHAPQLTAAQAAAYLANADPTMSTAEDIGRSGVTGAEQGAAGLAGTPGDVTGLFNHGAAYLLGKAAQGLQDLSHTNLGLPHHLTNADVAQMGNVVAQTQEIPTSGDMNRYVQDVAGPYHVPQTDAGRYAQRIAQFAPMLVGGEGSLLGKAADTVLAGTGSQAAENVAGNLLPDKYAPIAAMVGGAAGFAPGSFLRGIVNSPLNAAGRALEGMTPADIAAGSAVQSRSNAVGLQPTPFEALDQATGGRGKAGLALQHFIENSPYGQRLFSPFFAGRPEQARNAVMSLADLVAAPDNAPAASALANQSAASGLINATRQGINNDTNGLYEALHGQSLPGEAYAYLHANPSYRAAFDDLRGNPELAPLVPGQNNDLNTVMKVYQRLGELADEATPTAVDKSGSFTLASQREGARSLADMFGRAASSEWGQALDTQAARRQAELEPLQNGPVGQIATATDIKPQVGALHPKSPVEGTAAQTAAAASALPIGVVANLTRHNIVDTYNNAARDLVNGIENQGQGSRFARDIAGNREQESALYAALGAIDPSGSISDRMADILEGTRAMGRRMAPGSGTAFNEQRAAELGMSPAPVRTIGHLLDPLEWGKAIDKATGGIVLRRNIEGLAEALQQSPEQAAATLARAQRLRAGNASPILSTLLLASPATASQ